METGSQILQYTGNAGLGYNASIPAIDPKANLDFINSTARDIAMMNHANNIKLYEQKVKDRDTTLDLLAQGQISSGNIDPNDRPAYDAAKKEAQDSFYKMIQNGGLNNPQAVREYQDKVTNLKNTAIWAQHRQLGFTKLDQEAAQQTLPEDIAAYKKLREDAKKLSFWNQIPIHQKAFDYNINNIWNQALGLPTTASQLATPDNQTNQTETTQQSSITNKNGVITDKTTVTTKPIRSGLITNTKGKGITTTGTQINKDGSISEFSWTPEKYWDLPTILDNVTDLSTTNKVASYSYEKYKSDFEKLPPQQQLETLKAKNNRLAQYSQQRELEKPEQIKFYVDHRTGQVIIQETKESFVAKTALASINGDYVEVPQRQVDYKILDNNTRVRLEKMQQSGANYREGVQQAGANARTNMQIGWEKTKAGWTWDKKEGWKAPAKTAVTAANNGGIVPYWKNYVAPQIEGLKQNLSKQLGVSTSNIEGDILVQTDQVSGLGIAYFGETGKTIAEDTKVKVRFKNGNAIGIVLDGVFYDQNDIDTKATRMQNSNLSNKTDVQIFDNIPQQQQSTNDDSKLTDAQYFLKYKKGRSK